MRYTSDMSERQWEMIRPLLKQKGYRSIEKRQEEINAVLYLVKTGCQWRNLPKDFPNWKTVYSFYRRACLNGTWEMLQKEFVKMVRTREGRAETPTYAVIDSQSAKTAYSNEKRGYDGGKNKRTKATHSN